MPEELCCCLCCKPCLNEFQYLQNESGNCTEIYEITVKYFDPMLLSENINEDTDKSSCVLCENCWLHIKVFHEFHETVINGRNFLNDLTLPKISLDIKDGIPATVLNNTLDDKIQFEKDNALNDSNDEDIKSTQQVEEIELDAESNDERIYSGEMCKIKSKLRKKKTKIRKQPDFHSDKTEIASEQVITKGIKPLDNVVSNCNSQPALDKGNEYDKFIAEWKSQLECEICNETFPIFDSLKVHFKTKHNTRAFVKCCDRRFDRRCSLVEHIRMHINPEMHKCDICGKLIGSKYSLVYHKKTIHEESQKYKCSKCPKIFKQKQNLKCHLLTHVTGDKDFKCKECNKAYVHEIQLKKHIKLVHIDNRVCDQCGKTLHGIGALKNHLKEHDGLEKTKFPCEECGAQLGSRITLKRHKASYHHDGTTVYVCSICGKVSTTERALKNHKNFVHERERKFKCPNCDKAFKRAQNLQEHIATHTGEALYQCLQCPKTFKINSKYHEHRKKAHPIEWKEGRKNRLEKQKIDFERVKNQVIL